MAGKVGFFLGVPLAGPFFVGGGDVGFGGGGGDALVSDAPLAGVSALGVSVLVGSGEVGIPSMAGMGVGVLPWRA